MRKSITWKLCAAALILIAVSSYAFFHIQYMSLNYFAFNKEIFINPKYGRLSAKLLNINCTSINRTASSGDLVRMIYNRIPKCGSTTFQNLLKNLGKRNGFDHISSYLYNRRHLSISEQEIFVKKLKTMEAPLSIDRHLYFIDFSKFSESQPIYINVIREPINRLISAFYYVRNSALSGAKNNPKLSLNKKWLNLKYDDCVRKRKKECIYDLDEPNDQTLMIPYFCGHAEMCKVLGNKWALQKAKYNIENYYSVVGVLEEMNKTLSVFEEYVPEFFSGAQSFYHSQELHMNSGKGKKHVSSATKEMVKKNLTMEYELYEFVSKRLNEQYKKIS